MGHADLPYLMANRLDSLLNYVLAIPIPSTPWNPFRTLTGIASDLPRKQVGHRHHTETSEATCRVCCVAASSRFVQHGRLEAQDIFEKDAQAIRVRREVPPDFLLQLRLCARVPKYMYNGLLAWEAQSARSVGPEVRERCTFLAKRRRFKKKVHVQGLGKFVPHTGSTSAWPQRPRQVHSLASPEMRGKTTDANNGGMSGYLIEGCCEIMHTQNVFNEPQQHRYLHTARGNLFFPSVRCAALRHRRNIHDWSNHAVLGRTAGKNCKQMDTACYCVHILLPLRRTYDSAQMPFAAIFNLLGNI
ncbi:hypothetical protein DFH09DRAFT_1433104 [Mycena vulgaris]|nr:hypothetical protein DFH09DRAFT_1433104 [Mycena vulgaris]